MSEQYVTPINTLIENFDTDISCSYTWDPTQKINIVFLDISGVIHLDNPDQAIITNPAYIATNCKKKFGASQQEISTLVNFSQANINQLLKLCATCHAYIVLASLWRKNKTLQQLRNLFSLRGFGHLIIDKTTIHSSRGDEIATWLSAHKNIVHNFVILDDIDNNISNLFPKQFVYCDCQTGFTAALYNQAVSILQEQQ